VLAAEPLYLLVDTAVVGHLGAVPLAGLAAPARRALDAPVTEARLLITSYGRVS